MALWNDMYIISVESAEVALVIKVALGVCAVYRRSKLSCCLCCAEKNSLLAACSSFYMSDEVEKSFFVICACSREVCCTAKIISNSRCPECSNIIEEMLAKRFSNNSDKFIKINTTGKYSVKFFVNLNNLEGCADRCAAFSAESLTTDTLCTVCSFSNYKEIAVLDYKFILVAFSNISEVNECVKVFILFCSALDSLNPAGAYALLHLSMKHRLYLHPFWMSTASECQ